MALLLPAALTFNSPPFPWVPPGCHAQESAAEEKSISEEEEEVEVEVEESADGCCMAFYGEREIDPGKEKKKKIKGSGNWAKGDVCKEGKTKGEMWVKDKTGWGGGEEGKPRPFMHGRRLR